MNEFPDIFKRPGPIAVPDYIDDTRLSDPTRYQPSEELENAVNVAIHLGKPLLLTGEPGSGKTHLAHCVAARFGLKKNDGFYIFNTRTTSTATDLFYEYDALSHFQSAQQGSLNPPRDDADVEERFIHYKALGSAIKMAQEQEKRCVVLIDEVDKAPRDLPNDILNVLEDLEFEVPIIKKPYRAKPQFRPIIILTSNSEKNLPDAFLRRCVYFHLKFPGEEQLLAILTQKLTGELYAGEALRHHVIPHFKSIRKAVSVKKPSTSELLYWVSLLEKQEFPPEKLSAQLDDNANLTPKEQTILKMSYTILLKNVDDRKALEKTFPTATE